jgi:hypothetical protein
MARNPFLRFFVQAFFERCDGLIVEPGGRRDGAQSSLCDVAMLTVSFGDAPPPTIFRGKWREGEHLARVFKQAAFSYRAQEGEVDCLHWKRRRRRAAHHLS